MSTTTASLGVIYADHMTSDAGSPQQEPEVNGLDPDDPRPPYQQVAARLRAAILTKRLAPGEKLPSGAEMASTYGVARQTVQQALRLLRDEGLIVSRQGSGTFVKARTEKPVGLRPHVERAFKATEVTIDFAGFSGETLANAIQEPLDKIRAGRLSPESVKLRILVPNPAVPWALPCRTEDLADSPEFRQRMASITDRSLDAIRDSLMELGDLGLLATSVEIRAHGAAPLFKAYIINRQEVFFGFYPVTQHHMTYRGAELDVWDLGGKDAVLFHHSTSDEATSLGGLYVEQTQMWFDSMWNSVSREYAS